MIEYIKLSNYIKFGVDIDPVVNEIIKVTYESKDIYPNYTKWLLKKHLPGIYNGKRDTILALDNESNKIIGVCNIKNDKEKKICTLYIDKNYRKNKIGVELIKNAMLTLESNKPLITIPSKEVGKYTKVIKHYNWELTSIKDNLNKENTNEITFNGYTTEKKRNREDIILSNYKKTNDKNLLKLLDSRIKAFKLMIISEKSDKNNKKVLSN